MAKKKLAKKPAKKPSRWKKPSKISVLLIKQAEAELEKKKQELIEINARHKFGTGVPRLLGKGSRNERTGRIKAYSARQMAERDTLRCINLI